MIDLLLTSRLLHLIIIYYYVQCNSVVNQMPSQCIYVLEFIVSLVITMLGEILSVYVTRPLSDWSL